jgi:hypothetical protein
MPQLQLLAPPIAVNTCFPFAPPRHVTDLGDCYFYHTVDLPGYGTIPGEWDLRASVDDYLGRVPLAGKRVFEVGTANGFLCFEMERLGAAVVAHDLSDRECWDIVPFAQLDCHHLIADRRELLRKLHNAWWLAHRIHGSSARVVYGTAYDLPTAVGPIDVVTLGCVLLHLRDPFRALASATRLAAETVIVTEPILEADSRTLPWPTRLLRRAGKLLRLPPRTGGAAMTFLPHHELGGPTETWWVLPAELIRRFLGVLGFEDTSTTYHTQLYRGREHPLYTVVGRRTRAVHPRPS